MTPEKLPAFPVRLRANGDSGDGKELYIVPGKTCEWAGLSLSNDDVTIGQEPFRDEIIERYNGYGEALQRIAELEARVDEDNEVCLCGCPDSEHEIDSDGESCGAPDHECVRVSMSVRSIYLRERENVNRLTTELSEANRVVQDARNDNEAIHRELDRLRAPRRQKSGFGLSPLGRLRRLAVNEAGRGLVESIYRELDEARKDIQAARRERDEAICERDSMDTEAQHRAERYCREKCAAERERDELKVALQCARNRELELLKGGA